MAVSKEEKDMMMKRLKTPLAGLLAGFLAVTTSLASGEVQLEGAKVGQWTMDFAAAAKLAKEKKLPMMLNFTGSDWCGWCKLMDKGVFAKNEWKQYAAKNAVLVTLDFPNDKSIVPEKYVARNKELQRQFAVRGYPTYIVLDSDGETQLGRLGAGRDKTPASFIKEFKDATRFSEGSVSAYAKQNPDKAAAYKKALGEVRASQKALRDWIATGPERNAENDKKFESFKKRIAAANEALDKF